MPLIPFIISGTITQSDGSAYNTKTVWLTRSNQTLATTTNSSGQYVFDCANFNDYSDGDSVLVAMEAYADSGYHLTRNPFEDSTVDDIEVSGQRLNTATITVNLKVK